ncbi:putative polyketide synthase [Rosellinia necatrix]|uniref:Putative polyketide synthase n=1 Tax=Rosellinia necatrix TaxID=77044 RepID=A0A1S8A6C3_ROSNE|nr:putative polyketide synthase [Rosellinia necatrix]
MLDENSRYESERTCPIAICGMACRLPGGLSTPQQLWDFIIAKRDARCRVPASRYNIDAFHSPISKPASVASEYGYFLDESIDLGTLDTSFFSMKRSDVEETDPQERLMLEIARECIEDAGVTGWRGKSIGCYVGSLGEDWSEMSSRETQRWGSYKTGDFLLSNRISYEMDLQGPSMTIRTACSAAMVGLNEACMAISRGECEGALVGGTNLIMTPGLTTMLSSQGVLSKEGSCKTFSAEADGYARAEALVAIYIKPLQHALRDGNPIRAVIRSTTVNHDGKTPGIYQPSSDAQEKLMRRAYRLAGISNFGETAMVECHGTGTPTGDPIETRAVAKVFGDSGLYIGSVKPNVGHSEGASGLTSIIKMVFALENETIPPNIKFTTPNPDIPFEAAKLSVPTEPLPWPKSRQLRVSVNSFGVSGTNAHVILESAASLMDHTPLPTPISIPRLLLYSATTVKSLGRLRDQYRDWAALNPTKIDDLSYTLAHRREHLPLRTFAVIDADGTVNDAPDTSKASEKHRLVMVFTGQGAQWPQMGRELFNSNDVFRSTIRSLDQCLQDSIGGPLSYSIEDELFKPASESRLSSAAISQPLCTAIQIALVDAFRSVGAAPSAVVGHSSGEIAAAYAAGSLKAWDAFVVAHYRGVAASRQKRFGSMAAIGLGHDEVQKHLVPGASIACHNSPKSTTISGDTPAVQTVLAKIEQSFPSALSKRLAVDKAYHSSHMVEVGNGYQSSLERDDFRPLSPNVPFFSSVTGARLADKHPLGPSYWKANLVSPVLFNEAVDVLLKDLGSDNIVFLEIGPHSALAGPLRQILSSQPRPYASAMLRNRDSSVSFLTAAGNLFSFGFPLDLGVLIPNGRCLPDLPRYPWNHEETYWVEPRVSREWRLRKHPYHNLLGVKIPESTNIEPSWRNLLHIQNVPWIQDHKVGDNLVFPFAGYLSMVGEAISQVTGEKKWYSVRSVNADVALVLFEEISTEIVTTLHPCRLTNSQNSDWWDFTIASFNGHVWTKHCRGQVAALVSDFIQAEKPQDTYSRQVDASSWYKSMQRVGVDLGPCFQTSSQIKTMTTNQSTICIVPNERQADSSDYHIHPTALDVVFQLPSIAAVNGRSRLVKNWIPISIRNLSVTRCNTRIEAFTSSAVTSNGSLNAEGYCTSSGETVIKFSGIRLTPADGVTTDELLDTHAAARLEWGTGLDFVSSNELLNYTKCFKKQLHELEELSVLYVLLMEPLLCREAMVDGPPDRFLAWRAAMLPQKPLTEGKMGEINTSNIEARILALEKTLSSTPASYATKCLRQRCSEFHHRTTGSAVDSVLPYDLIDRIHKFMYEVDITLFVRHMRHHKPGLRILELGMGTDTFAWQTIKALTRRDGNTFVSKYTSDSTCFGADRTDKIQSIGLETTTFNIGESLDSQGFEDQEYDLIIVRLGAGQLKNTQTAFENIQKLLGPNGRLLLQELPLAYKWALHVFGPMVDWSLSRLDESNLASKLMTSGFQIDARSISAIEEVPYQTTLVIKRADLPAIVKKVTFLRTALGKAPSPIMSHFMQQGYDVTECLLADRPSPEQDIISLLDEDGPFLGKLDESQYNSLNEFLQHLQDSGIIWITRHSQIECDDPGYGQIIGLARTLRSEMLLDFATCEVDEVSKPPPLIIDIFERFQCRRNDKSIKPDFEYVIKNEHIYTGRYYPFALKNELMSSDPVDRVILNIDLPGRLNTLHWAACRRDDLKADEVEIEVHAAGLNFKDVVIALGIVELPIRQFGSEVAGLVKRVGRDVKNIKVGDRVCCPTNQGFSTFVKTAEMFCVPLPEKLDFEEASTMLIPFGTVLYSLVNIGQLNHHETKSILIHSACGGVGLAAIQVAKLFKAEIYVTVGTEEKAQFLTKRFGIPRSRIFNSRDSSFRAGIMAQTDGEGVDLVLNSLSGELLHASWECVAEFGTMIEIGKRDLLGDAKLDMRPFLSNRSYRCVNFDQIWKKPTIMVNLLHSIFDEYHNGSFSPIHPIKMFRAQQVNEAFQYMQKGEHIGRIGITMASSKRSTVRPIPRSLRFESHASYLLIGGLGGIGRALSIYMVEHGARELVYLSRSAGTTMSDAAFAAELHSMGCETTFVKGDVCNKRDVAEAVRKSVHPLKGIVQLSMVLRDQNFSYMTFDQWQQATAPKIQGTVNLHHATVDAGIDLNFFVLCSSIAGQVGQPGQANYASANTFLDAFSRYRNKRGLAASVVDIGAVEDVGALVGNEGLLNKMKANGFHAVSEQELLDAFMVAMFQDIPSSGEAIHGHSHRYPNQFVIGLGPALPLIWKNDRRMSIYTGDTNTNQENADSKSTLKLFLADVATDPSALKSVEAGHLLSVEIGKKLADMLLKSQDEALETDASLASLGMDSLVAAELRAWWRQVFRFDISVREMLGMGTLSALGKLAAEGLLKQARVLQGDNKE